MIKEFATAFVVSIFVGLALIELGPRWSWKIAHALTLTTGCALILAIIWEPV